jgi:hypothetical protein
MHGDIQICAIATLYTHTTTLFGRHMFLPSLGQRKKEEEVVVDTHHGFYDGFNQSIPYPYA